MLEARAGDLKADVLGIRRAVISVSFLPADVEAPRCGIKRFRTFSHRKSNEQATNLIGVNGLSIGSREPRGLDDLLRDFLRGPTFGSRGPTSPRSIL